MLLIFTTAELCQIICRNLIMTSNLGSYSSTNSVSITWKYFLLLDNKSLSTLTDYQLSYSGIDHFFFVIGFVKSNIVKDKQIYKKYINKKKLATITSFLKLNNAGVLKN